MVIAVNNSADGGEVLAEDEYKCFVFNRGKQDAED